MNWKLIKNVILETIIENNEKFGLVSAILILYYNPLMYFAIITVGSTVELYQKFNYDINFNFIMKKIDNIELETKKQN